MAKNKKKTDKKGGKKNQSFYKTIKPFIQDNRVIYSLLGAVGVGVALASAFGTAQGRTLVERLTSAVKDFGQSNTSPEEPSGAEPAMADKKPKAPKPFSVEHS